MEAFGLARTTASTGSRTESSLSTPRKMGSPTMSFGRWAQAEGTAYGSERAADYARCEMANCRPSPETQGAERNRVISLVEDRQGTLWVGTDGHGLERIQNGTVSAFTTKEGLSNDTVSAIMEDDEGSLWLGTFGGGLVRLKDASFVTYGNDPGLHLGGGRWRL